ncbi:MAG: hypothetical protein PHQ23_12645 [Candidatus Wallbacteria bacterium]|nr:hypothetical protein [Candidatus Wallbacteria bacterium]
MTLRLSLLLALMLAPGFIPQITAADVNCYFTSHEVRIGEPVDLILEINHDQNEELLAIPDLSATPEAFITGEEPLREVLRDRNKIKCRFHLQFFSLGKAELRPVRLKFAGNREIIIPTQEIMVIGVIGEKDTAEIMDLKPPFSLNLHRDKIIKSALIALIVLLIAAILYWLFRLRKPHQPSENTVWDETLAPVDEARKALNQARILFERKLFQHQYYLMSEILRRYFGRCCGVLLLEKTTDEVLAALPDSLPEGIRDSLSDMLSSWDMIKYARAEVEAGVAGQDLRKTVELIEEHHRLTEPPIRENQ